jgi:acyl carrier protein
VNTTSPEDIQKFLTSFLNQRLSAQEQSLLNDLPGDYDLLLSGKIDSLGFVELIAAVAEHFGREIDYDELNPENMTVVGPLCRFVSEQLGKA